MRLNAYLARTGIASRRGADELIKRGRIRVNGVTAELNTFVEEGDVVDLDGKLLVPQRVAYVLLHKPAAVVTTASDPHGRPTVVDLVEHESRVVPVGRLDADTTGVLLLTNDGDLAHRLAHPRYEVDKVYEAEVEGEPSDEALAGSSRASSSTTADRPRESAPPRPVTRRALDPRGPQAPGEAHARGGRPPGHAPAPQPLRRARPPRASSQEQWRELTDDEVASAPRASLVEGEHGQHDVERDERPALERDRLAVAGDLPDRDRHHASAPM